MIIYLIAKRGDIINTNSYKKNKTKIITAIIWICIIVFIYTQKDKITIEGILNYTPNNTFFAILVMIALFAVKSLSVVLYIGLLYAASGIIFPLPLAIAVNVAGTFVQVSTQYFVGRKNGENMLEYIKEKFPKTKYVTQLRKRNDFLFVLLIRVIGILPADIVSMYMGAAGIKYKTYISACILGMLPKCVLFSIMGMSAKDIRSPQFIISVIIEICLVVASALYAYIRGKKDRKSKVGNNA